MKKGQTEMIGLLVIVVLILVIGVVFLRFSVGKPSDLKADLRTNIQTTNLLRAVMKANIDDRSVADAILECSANSAQCDEVKAGIKEILDISIGKGREYSFTATIEDREIMSIGTCQDVGIVASYQASRKGTLIDSKLKVC